MGQLSLDRSLQDDQFVNWRLGVEFLQSRSFASLTQPLAVADSGGVNDYLNTRASVLHNHLHVCGDSVYLFTKAGDGALTLCEASPCLAASPSFLIQHLALFPAPTLPPGTALPPGACMADCSLVEVAPMPPPVTSGGTPQERHLLVSCGAGDLHLVHVGADEGAVECMTPPVYPLREQAPLMGVRPFKLEGAYWVAPGVLRCVLWAVRTKTAQHSAACEVYLATLSTPAYPKHAAGAPVVTDIQLMAHSGLPPHCVMCDAVSDSVLLGCDPNDLQVMPDACQKQTLPGMPPTQATKTTQSTPTEQTEQAPQGAQAVAAGAPTAPAAAAPPAAAGAGSQQGEQLQQPDDGGGDQARMETDGATEHIECRPAAWRATDDMDEDSDIDPRTLAAAAARLAQYTSEEAQGPLPAQQWADIYKEGGPEDVAADTGCEMIQWRAGSGAQASEPWRLSCGAHKVLSSDTPGLLAVTDDVDACVLSLGWPAAQEGQTMAQPPDVRHVATIPALAYISAGKTQRKHLLIGMPRAVMPDCPCSAVLVEGTKFLYVYGQVDPKRHYGYQQVVDMELSGEERVLGARLLVGPPWTAQGSRQATVLLVTQKRLMAFVLGI